MVFSLVRLLFLSLFVASAFARLPPRSILDTSSIPDTNHSLHTSKDASPADSQVSPPCNDPLAGHIFVSFDDNPPPGGYLAPANRFGRYDRITPTTDGALRASFCPDDAAGGKTFNIYISNSNPADACLGAAREFSRDEGTFDDNSNSLEYPYVTQTVELPKGPATRTRDSFPPRDVFAESSIWMTDLPAERMVLNPVWTNPNGSLFSAILSYEEIGLGLGRFQLVNSRSNRYPLLFLRVAR